MSTSSPTYSLGQNPQRRHPPGALYRLNGVTIALPPLRERGLDVELLFTVRGNLACAISARR